MSKNRLPHSGSVVHLALALSAGAVSLAVWALLRTAPWHIHFGADTFKNVAGGISSIITGAAVVIGGLWTYFKFLRGRTFHPRLAVRLDGEWRRLEGADVLHVRVTVTNIGATKVALNQFGSGLEIGFPASVQDGDEVSWKKIPQGGHGPDEQPPARVFSVLTEHEWIEPGETVCDDLLLNLGKPPGICLLEVDLLWALSDKEHGDYSDKDIDVFARRILPPDAKITDKVED